MSKPAPEIVMDVGTEGRPVAFENPQTPYAMRQVRDYYGVPARRGAEVVFTEMGRPITGTILSSTGSHLYFRAHDGRRIGPCHPLSFDYGDGIDHKARMDRRVARFNDLLNGRGGGS